MKRRTRGLQPRPRRTANEFGYNHPKPPKDTYQVVVPGADRVVLRHIWPDRNKYKPHRGAKQRGGGK